MKPRKSAKLTDITDSIFAYWMQLLVVSPLWRPPLEGRGRLPTFSVGRASLKSRGESRFKAASRVGVLGI